MKKTYLYSKLIFAACLSIIIGGCSKENGIDNNNVIKTPYPLFVSDIKGSLYNLYNINNDTFRICFPPDGFPMRSIVVSGENILFVKGNTHISTTDGSHFDNTELAVTPWAAWQSLMVKVPSHNRIYLAIDSAAGYGIKYSEDDGKTWAVDTRWYKDVVNPQNNKITSFTQLKNGVLFCNDYQNDKLFRRDGKDEEWVEVTMSNLPTSGAFYLSHLGNTLIMADYSGFNGVWHSEDNGQTWSQYYGLPNVPVLSVEAPFEDVLLVGTDSLGVFRLQSGFLVSSNNGLSGGSSVHGITGKENIYKDGTTIRHYYVATSKGLYRSINKGQDWVLVSPNNTAIKDMNFTAIY